MKETREHILSLYSCSTSLLFHILTVNGIERQNRGRIYFEFWRAAFSNDSTKLTVLFQSEFIVLARFEIDTAGWKF